MTFAEAVSRIPSEFAAVFKNSGYLLFNIEAHIVSIIILVILLARQQSSSDQTEARIAWIRLVFAQILYCLSEIFRVFADVNIIPKSGVSKYAIESLNFALIGCVCWLVFMYTELYQKSNFLKSLKNKIIAALPFVLNVIIILSSPFTGLFMDIKTSTTGILFPLMSAVNLAYLAAAAGFAVVRRRKMTRYERDIMPIVAGYPAFFAVCLPLQALNWRMPIMCYAVVIADIFVYISNADSLVSIDPLTKIANRNGLMRSLSERFSRGNLESLYLFVVDVDDLASINSNYGRQEGDKALMLTAEALKKFRKEEHECYIAHYYGDEFILTSDIQDKEELDLFIEHIRNYISNMATANGLRYLLRVNIGWSKYEQFSKTETISGLIDEAVRVLNENKEQRRFQTLWRSSRT